MCYVRVKSVVCRGAAPRRVRCQDQKLLSRKYQLAGKFAHGVDSASTYLYTPNVARSCNFLAASGLIYQQRQQQQYGSVTRDPRGSSPSSSRPASASSSTSQWQSTFSSETFLPRQENWNSEVYASKRSGTPTWTELGTQLDPRNSSWDRQNGCYQKKSSPVSTWNADHVGKRPSSATGGVPTWSDVAVGYQQQRRGSLQLWQFLVALLDDPANAPCIAWTGRGMEFKLIEPEEVSEEEVLIISVGLAKFFRTETSSLVE